MRDDAIQHYQAQVPGLRAAFERSHRALRKHFEVQEQLFTHNYIDALFDLADSEVRKRTELAAESLASAIEAGWRPSSDEIAAAYLDCFAWNEASRDSFSDVVAIIQQAIGNLGRPPDDELTRRFESHVGRIQAETADQHKAKLRLDVQRAAATSSRSPAIVNNYLGPVGAVQTGNQNVANVTQTARRDRIEALHETLVKTQTQVHMLTREYHVARLSGRSGAAVDLEEMAMLSYQRDYQDGLFFVVQKLSREGINVVELATALNAGVNGADDLDALAQIMRRLDARLQAVTFD